MQRTNGIITMVFIFMAFYAFIGCAGTDAAKAGATSCTTECPPGTSPTEHRSASGGSGGGLSGSTTGGSVEYFNIGSGECEITCVPPSPCCGGLKITTTSYECSYPCSGNGADGDGEQDGSGCGAGQIVCGSVCCTSGQQCVNNGCCDPDCGEKQCGLNTCGVSCGECADGSHCDDGTCIPDIPLCDNGGPQCPGGVDGCCEPGQVCYNDDCCDKQCESKECGDDQCGGVCGNCEGEQDVCDDGICVCMPDCEDKDCGQDGCGELCGECDLDKTCSDDGQCLSLEEVTGCSDGTREGFINTTDFPDIASCEATWVAQSLRGTRSHSACGNTLETECTVPEDACTEGWHLCMKNGWPKDLSDRITGDDCGGAIAGQGWFVSGSSVSIYYCDSTPPISCLTTGYGSNPISCGIDVALGAMSCTNVVWQGNTRTFTQSGSDDFPCGLIAGGINNATGLLCCRDPQLTGE